MNSTTKNHVRVMDMDAAREVAPDLADHLAEDVRVMDGALRRLRSLKRAIQDGGGTLPHDVALALSMQVNSGLVLLDRAGWPAPEDAEPARIDWDEEPWNGMRGDLAWEMGRYASEAGYLVREDDTDALECMAEAAIRFLLRGSDS